MNKSCIFLMVDKWQIQPYESFTILALRYLERNENIAINSRNLSFDGFQFLKNRKTFSSFFLKKLNNFQLQPHFAKYSAHFFFSDESF